jgi:superfamily I DNA and RNA helicase
MITISKGFSQKPASTDKLIHFFKSKDDLDGHFYVGYPVLFAGGESLTADALWISKDYGIVIFDVIEGTKIDDRSPIQDDLYIKISSLLSQHTNLNIKRQLAVKIEVITFAPAASPIKSTGFPYARNEKELSKFIQELDKWDNNGLFETAVAVIQSVIKLKVPSKRSNITKEDSRGAIIKKLEDTIANLDQEQEKAVIEAYEGIQRLRGLAGSGKTIVLALKAAYYHAQHPDWNIAVTFNTRSLKNQFKELIERFCISKKGEMPDWDKLRIVQAWGSPTNTGIYYEVCKEYGIEYFDFRSAENYKTESKAFDKTVFDVICSKALTEISKIREPYDAIFVDEAQDLSESFLKICYKILKEPKRLIYAYDELQKLNEGSPLRNPSKLFGKDANDTMLYKCYRNSRPLLVTAHALGFGIYREKGLVQFFDQPQLWKDVGYKVKEGKLEANSNVVLYRDNEASPEYLEKHSSLDDILLFKSFSNSMQQADWVVKQIKKNITDDELLYRDIIVINPDARTTKKEVAQIRSLLLKKSINSHIAGDINADMFFEKDSITFTGINRAKGNEVPMVYVINADDCYADKVFENRELINKRNILFTAITRSKAWVRVCGVGARMDSLMKEYEEVRNRNYELHFRYPTDEEIKEMNLIHRDISQTEKQKLSQDVNTLSEVLKIIERIKAGEAYIKDYPKEIQKVIKSLL